MQINEIVKRTNEKLAGETLLYSQLQIYFDEVIDDINAKLNSTFPAFSEVFNTSALQGNTDYNYFPDKYIRSVVVVGAAYKFYCTDEEGIASAQQYAYDYATNLFIMERDYSNLVPDEYKAEGQGFLKDVKDMFKNNPELGQYLYVGTDPVYVAIQGFQGAKGEKGEKGDKGERGLVGPTGPRGKAFTYEDFTPEQLELLKVIGPMGPTGPRGPEGKQGEQGKQGARGPAGPTGPRGPEGASLTKDELKKLINDVFADDINAIVQQIIENEENIDGIYTELKNKVDNLKKDIEAFANVEVDKEQGKVYVKVGDERVIELDIAEYCAAYYDTYGISIDLNNENPATRVTYTDDAVGMVAGSPDWSETSIFRNIRPCMFKDGAVVKYLNPNDFTKYEDGTNADIVTGAEGDLMIEIPKLGVKFTNDGSVLTVQITNNPNAKGFSYYAHTRDVEGDREKLYIGGFFGCNKDSKLCSLSGAIPLTKVTIAEARELAQAKGVGYDQIAFYPLTLLQALYLIKYKNTNSQAALGRGNVATGKLLTTGNTVKKGMDFGNKTSGAVQVKFLGIEDFWGNLSCWVDGVSGIGMNTIRTATNNFNDYPANYKSFSTPYSSGFMKVPHGTNELGFIVKSGGGSETTYFADHTSGPGSANTCASFGGSYGDSSWAGVFSLTCNVSRSSAFSSFGCRLMYL